jgi:hypothetical protein
MTVPEDVDRLLVPDYAAGRARLGDGWSLAWVVDSDGQRWPFILDDRIIHETTNVPWGPGLDQLAPHEALGPSR